ncbi:MAG: hypothetical protein Fur0041_17730 [Bacteroidia bacterium]
MRIFRLIFLLLVVHAKTFACDCKGNFVFNDSLFSRYEMIFRGKVVSVNACSGEATALFNIETLYKGKAYSQTELLFDCSSDCAMNFTSGEEWIIYANYVGYGKPKAEFCSPSRLKYSAADDPALLTHGFTFQQEDSLLRATLGTVAFNEKKENTVPDRTLQYPDQKQFFIYTILGLAGLGVIYLITKKLFN